MKPTIGVLLGLLALSAIVVAQDKPRVFMSGKGTVNGMTKGAAGGTHNRGGWWAAGRTDSIEDSHDESMELAKEFASGCAGVQVTVNADAADYVTSLNRESKAKKGLFSKNNQIQVSNKSGDVLLSSTARSVATAAKDACNVIMADFATHGHAKAASSSSEPAVIPKPVASSDNGAQLQSAVLTQSSSTELAITSNPDGADIEVDGKFVGNTPSSLSVEPGEHTIVLRMEGHHSWQRTVKTSGGKVKLNGVLSR